MDPALGELGEAYRGGDLVLFAGAGLSAAAGLPSWARLIELLTERARARDAAAATLAEITAFAQKQQFIDALSALKDCLGPADFGVAIERHLDDQQVDRLPEIALAIGALRSKLRAVLTTNIDGLLERAFDGAWPALPRATPDIAQRRRFILKLHGTRLDRSTWVFTRDEYDRAMHADERLKQAFGALFNACTLLFVGYGLADDDFDAILARVRAFAGEQPPRHFALIAAEEVTPFRRSRLERSGVRLIAYDNTDGKHTEVVRILRELGVRGMPTASGLGTSFGERRHTATDRPVLEPIVPSSLRLPHVQVRELCDAAIQLGLAHQRMVLLAGLNEVEAMLPSASDPAGQLLSDLLKLNAMGRLRDGTVPLVTWLETALHLTKVRIESEVFERALATLRGL